MENILGITASKSILNIVQEIGTILFSEFPTTILYIDTNQNLLIKEWADCSDDGLTDRFFYYRTTKLNVARFFQNKQSHLDLIRNSEDGLVYFQDINSNNLSDLTILSANKIPNDYLPSSNFTLSNKDIVDLEKINKFLDIDNINLNIDISQTVKEFAK